MGTSPFDPISFFGSPVKQFYDTAKQATTAIPVATAPLPQPAVCSPFQEKRFYVVWRSGGGSPTVTHPTLALAETEADRLARLNPSARFYILSNLESVTVPTQPKPPAIWQSAGI